MTLGAEKSLVMGHLFRCTIVGATLSLSTFTFFVEESLARSNEPIHIIQLDPKFDVSKLKKPGLKIHKIGERRTPKKPIPRRQERDRVFAAVGISADVKSMDQMARDILFMRADYLPISKLVQKYKFIGKRKLMLLKKNVRSHFRKVARR